MNTEKNRKRAATLSLALLVLCAGCQSAPKSWESSIDATEPFRRGIEDALGDDRELMDNIDLDDFTLHVTAEAQEDGSYKLTVDEKAVKRAVSDAVEALLEGMEEREKSAGNILAGDWVCEFDATDTLSEGMESAIEGASKYFHLHDFIIKTDLSFAEDGTFRFSADKAALRQSAATFREDIMEGYGPYLKSLLEDAGIEMSVEEYLVEQTGQTLEECAQEMADEAFGEEDEFVDRMVASWDLAGTYEADGLILRLMTDDEEENIPYTVEGSTLNLMADGLGLVGYDMVFTKK